MKIRGWLLLLTLVWVSVSGFGQNYTRLLESERVRNNTEMREEVLDSAEAAVFQGICYFPIDSAFVITATFRKDIGKKFVMPMTKARTVYYRQYGILTFKIHDTLCELPVYQNMDMRHDKTWKNFLFLPFRDGTTAVSTYGGGRYLDIRIPKNGIWVLDFNRAYHPYCVYSHRYSCPIPPDRNTITPWITAGECYTSPHE